MTTQGFHRSLPFDSMPHGRHQIIVIIGDHWWIELLSSSALIIESTEHIEITNLFPLTVSIVEDCHCCIFCEDNAIFFGIVAAYAPVTFAQQLGYFILAGFLGYYLIWNVEPSLFSPLMSTSNALSGVVILGGLLMVSSDKGSPASVLGCCATGVAAINVFGGFAVSYRMLLMFKKEN